jgi:HK97 family phage major capsid protein
MDKEQMKGAFKEVVDEALEKSITEVIGPEVAKAVKTHVDKMRSERALTGKDISGVDAEQKVAFVKDLKAIARGEKAALLENNDSTGGYLVPSEVYAGIKRIAETVGLVARDATFFPMSSDQLDVPRYTGSALQGEYIGEDDEGSETSVSFEDARLLTKTWILVIRIGNTLINDANVDVADWLMGLAAEGMAYRLDREGFVGGTFAGSPFVGLLGSSDVTIHTMATGSTSFDDFGIAEASDAIGALPTSSLNEAAFYFHRTVWAKIRSRSTSGVFEFGQYQPMLATLRRENGIQPVGEILGYPVYTSDLLPAFSTSAISTKFGAFANLRQALYIGDRGPMEVAKSDSATVGGKNLFLANQVAIRFIHRHAVAIGLPSAAVVIKTPAA